MHEIHGGSDFRLHDDYGKTLSSVGQRLMLSLAGPTVTQLGFFLSMTASEIEPFSLFPDIMFIFDCLSVVIHWISKKAFT